MEPYAGRLLRPEDDREGSAPSAVISYTLWQTKFAADPRLLGKQAKLLRFLESGEIERVGSSKTSRVDVRVLSATNADLPREVEAGRFREDLLFRLNTIELRLPPLRERREDVAPLAAHFLAHHAGRYRRTLTGFAPGALQALLQHNWPGNVHGSWTTPWSAPC